MTQEDKELLLKDLCARLPYGIKASYYGVEEERETWDVIEGITLDGYVDIGQYSLPIEGIKPYLFPLSSMTEEQYNEFFSYCHNIEMAEVKASGDYLKAAYIGDDAKYSWLNKNHFDYRELIEKGLAIDATGLNIYD